MSSQKGAEGAEKKDAAVEKEAPVAAEEVLDNLYELSQSLNTGLSRETLANSLDLIDDGLDPSTLADVLLALRDGSGT